MPAGRPNFVRATALTLAIGVNALFLFLLLLSSHRATPVLQPPVTAMIWVDAPEPPPQPPRAAPAVRSRQQRPDVNTAPMPAVPITQLPATATEPNAAIDAPLVDWHAEAERAVERFARNEGREQGKVSLDSQPKALALPDKSQSRQAHVEHFEGGVEITIQGDCATTRNPLAMQPWVLDPVARFFGNRATRGGGCTPNPSRERAEALEKAVKPGYLGGTRPLPPESATRIKIP